MKSGGVGANDAAQRCVWWRRLQAVKCQGSFAGNQTLAAMVFQSEAQDKAKSTEFNAGTSTRCRAGSGRALELELALL